MAKKIEEAEVKKECPSCGLGVALDSKICEFCGWDFEEEDEWILQIEKLERDLVLEKQKFAPGSVNEKIESTLHSPLEELKVIQAEKGTLTETVSKPEEEERAPVAETHARIGATQAPTQAPKVRRVRTVKQAPAVQSQPQPAVSGQSRKKVRLVRKVK